jgi:hypothetical protein
MQDFSEPNELHRDWRAQQISVPLKTHVQLCPEHFVVPVCLSCPSVLKLSQCA